MTISINIPDDLERLIRDALGDNIDRAAIEAIAIEGYRAGRLSAAQVGRLVGISDRWQIGEWLAARKVQLNYSADDLEADRRTFARLDNRVA